MSFKKIAAGVLAIGACLASFSSFQAGAHHAFGAEFDEVFSEVHKILRKFKFKMAASP